MRRLFGLALLAASVLQAAPAMAQSLEDMAGQMILVGFQGESANAPGVKAVAADIAAGRAGGVLYLKTNVASLGAVQAINAELMAARPELPPLISLDQEGGSVERLTSAVGFDEIPSAVQVAASDTPAEAFRLYSTLAQRLKGLGFNLNFGPVVDLNINPDNPVIARYGRSFGADAQTVETYADAFIRAHREAGVLTALKHFPGHGSSTTDSHEGFTDISKTWTEQELAPYRDLVGRELADMVMVGHLYHAGMDDPSQGLLPASLSPGWINRVLRGDLGFNGVVISDDMEMGAIRDHYSLEEAVKRAVMAGTDILLFSNTADARPTLAGEVQRILVDAAKADPAFRARVEQSYGRIVGLKHRLG